MRAEKAKKQWPTNTSYRYMGQNWQKAQQFSGAMKREEQVDAQISHRMTLTTAPVNPLVLDVTTGLENRDGYLRHLCALNGYANQFGDVAVLILDLDHFRTINHSLGINVGDQILSSVGKRILENVNSETDRVFRIGGNEFAVVRPIALNPCNSTTNKELSVERYALMLTEAITKPHTLPAPKSGENNEVLYRGGVSVGVALLDSCSGDALAAHDSATVAMREAKRAGGGCIRFFRTAFSRDFKLRQQMETALREAVKNKELKVVYQAQVDEYGTPQGAEALLRWTCPELGAVSPGTFIKLGEELGLIGDIGEFVIESVCEQIAAWEETDTPLKDLSLAVNVSALQFYDRNLDQTVARILDRTGADPGKLKFEITESALMENLEHARQVLRALRNMGIGVALDDFGTGYTSFEYLRNLPITEIKIDRSFIRRIETDLHDKIITRTILDLGAAMGIDVVAEGFENENQVRQLREMGCRRFQGFHFARPVSPADFERYISKYNTLCEFC